MLAFVVLAYAISWVCFLAYVVPNWGSFDMAKAIPYLLVGQFGPSIAALVMTGRAEGRAGVKRLLRRLLIFRFAPRWWFAAGWLIGATLLVTSIAVILLTEPQDLSTWLSGKWQVVLLPLVGLIGAIFGAGPLGEELGWRGYLLPRLIERHSPIMSSLILGLVWTFWHLPLFVIPEWRNGLSLPLFTILYPVSVIIISHGMYVLWKNTRGSIFAAILAHATLNTGAANLMPEFVSPVAGYIAAVSAMALWVLIIMGLDDRTKAENPYRQEGGVAA